MKPSIVKNEEDLVLFFSLDTDYTENDYDYAPTTYNFIEHMVWCFVPYFGYLITIYLTSDQAVVFEEADYGDPSTYTFPYDNYKSFTELYNHIKKSFK